MITYIGSLLADAGVAELRVHQGERWISGIFDSASALQASGEANAAFNIYTTLNRSTNVPVTNRMGSRALSDADIQKIVRLPFDFDPVRLTGQPSTEAELNAALNRRNKFVSMLSALQWPMPAMGMSGNGAHALYRCSLKNSTETKEMLAAIYRGLREDYSDEAVLFDASVRNPSRIWRLYGTLNRKGVDSPERPHRQATVQMPSRWEGVSPRQIEQLANRYTKQRTEHAHGPLVPVVGKGDFTTLDAVTWFQAHGLYKRRIGAGKHAVSCPWNDEHSSPDTPYGTDTVIWDAEPGRWPTWHCSHAHCEHRTIRDVVRLLQDADAFCTETWRRAAA
jgi:hypothetical protein